MLVTALALKPEKSGAGDIEYPFHFCATLWDNQICLPWVSSSVSNLTDTSLQDVPGIPLQPQLLEDIADLTPLRYVFVLLS